MIPRLPVALLITLVVLATAAPAAAYFTAGTGLAYRITTAAEFPDVDTVWVCKLTGPRNEPRLKPPPNPIRVSAAAVTDGRFNDPYGSLAVPSGSDCEDHVNPPE